MDSLEHGACNIVCIDLVTGQHQQSRPVFHIIQGLSDLPVQAEKGVLTVMVGLAAGPMKESAYRFAHNKRRHSLTRIGDVRNQTG